MPPTPFSLGTINQMAFGIARNKIASIIKLLLFTDTRQNIGKRAAIAARLPMFWRVSVKSNSLMMLAILFRAMPNAI